MVWSDKKKIRQKEDARESQAKKCNRGRSLQEYKFSPLEEAIINICAMSESVEGSSDEKRFGLPSCIKKRKLEECGDSQKENIAEGSSQIKKTLQSNQLSSDFDESYLTELLFNSDDDGVTATHERSIDLNDPGNRTNKTKQKGQQKTTTTDILQKELQLQRELSDQIGEALLNFKNHQTEMEANVKKVYRSLDRLYGQQKRVLQETKRHNNEMKDMKRHEIGENQRHNAEMEKLRKQEIVAKIEHKKRLLEIEEEKLKRL